MITRWIKIILLAAMAVDLTIIAFTNMTDYGSNFSFVQHVLSMDTTFPGNHCLWRAIHWPPAYHIAYVFLIFLEMLIAVFCWTGAIKLFQARRDPIRFHQKKKTAYIGLSLSMILWFVGFMVIGGDWFLMWQSPQWSGQEAAFRMAAITGIILIFLALPENSSDA